MHFLSQLAYLHFIVLVVKKLSIGILQFHSEGLYLDREPFYFNSLEDYDKIEPFREIALLVIGQVHYSRT